MESDSTVADFCRTVFPELSPKAAVFVLRENTRETLGAGLPGFYANRVARPLDPGERESIERTCEALNGRKVTMGDDLKAAFSEPFDRPDKTCALLPDYPRWA